MDEQNGDGMPSRRAVWSVQYWTVVRGSTAESVQGIVSILAQYIHTFVCFKTANIYTLMKIKLTYIVEQHTYMYDPAKHS